MAGPASISNSSSDNTKKTSWVLIWIIAVLSFVLAVVAMESGWRGLRYQPGVVDSPALWKYWYQHISCGRPASVAIIGSSRIQTGICAPQLRQRLPHYRIAQLGKDGGGSPIGVLRALASDDDFKGIVICDMLVPFLPRTTWGSQRELYGCSAGPSKCIESMVRACIQDRVAFNGGKTGVVAGLRSLVDTGELPIPDPVRMRADRTLSIDFAAIDDLEADTARDVAQYRGLYEAAPHLSADDLRDELSDIDQFVRRIQARGGQVVFVRMPSSGGLLKLEEQYHPKATYWDQIATMCSGVFIHAADLAAAPGLVCPDDSHLDSNDAARFTDVLIDELLRRKILERR
jgi:hypothetical protein